MLPGSDPTAIDVLLGVGIIVVVNTLISNLLVRRGDRPSGAVMQFVVTFGINVAIVLAGQFVLANLRGMTRSGYGLCASWRHRAPPVLAGGGDWWCRREELNL